MLIVAWTDPVIEAVSSFVSVVASLLRAEEAIISTSSFCSILFPVPEAGADAFFMFGYEITIPAGCSQDGILFELIFADGC